MLNTIPLKEAMLPRCRLQCQLLKELHEEFGHHSRGWPPQQRLGELIIVPSFCSYRVFLHSWSRWTWGTSPVSVQFNRLQSHWRCASSLPDKSCNPQRVRQVLRAGFNFCLPANSWAGVSRFCRHNSRHLDEIARYFLTLACAVSSN